MRIQRLTLGPVLCIAAASLGFPGFLPQRAFSSEAASSETARSISTMSVNDRMNLPDSTMVKFKSGRTVSLGKLRSEHRARLLHFNQASALGGSVAAKLAAHQPGPAQQSPAQQSPPLANVHPAPAPGAKGTGGMTKGNTNVGAAPTIANSNLGVAPKVAIPMMVPFHPLAGVTLPKDYVDFCAAAHPTACVYFPPDSVFSDTKVASGVTLYGDLDTYIIDEKTCLYDGGIFAGGDPPAGCWFYYPSHNIVNFLPKGPLTKTWACDPPGTGLVDPKGAAVVSISTTAFPLTTDSRPITCVVQVWVGG